MAPVRNVVLLLPSPDSEESVRILTERSAPPEGFDWHRHFVTHPSNGVLAKLVVYTAGQTPSQTRDAVYRRLFRTASGGAPMLGVPVVPEHRQAALGTIGQGVVRVQRAPVAQQQIGPVSPPAEHT